MAGVDRHARIERGRGHRPGAGLARALRVLGAVCLALTLTLVSAAAASAETGISGDVTDAATKAPIAGIEVCAFDLAIPLLGGEELPEVACAKTDAGGEYTIAHLRSGEYEVDFVSPAGSGLNYVAQSYDGKSSFSEATPG